MIDAINEEKSLNYLVGAILLMSALIAFSSSMITFLKEKSTAIAQNARMRYRIMAFDKMLYTDYSNIESHEGRLKFEKSKDFAFGGRWFPGQKFFDNNVYFLNSLLGPYEEAKSPCTT